MKKTFYLAFFVLTLSLCGCEYSYSNENSEPQAGDNANATQGTDNNGVDNNGAVPQGADAVESGDTEPVSESDVEVVAEYSLASIDDTEYFLVVKNNSKKAVRIYSAAIAYNGKGEEIGAAEGAVDDLPSGCETVIFNEFRLTTNVKKFKYDLEVVEETFYQPAIQNVKVTTKRLDRKVIVKCKNVGKDDIEHLYVTVLFFKGKKLVKYSSEYFMNSNFLIVPGKEITKQFINYKQFDDVKVYLSGKIYKESE